jgi:hypothetical protein
VDITRFFRSVCNSRYDMLLQSFLPAIQVIVLAASLPQSWSIFGPSAALPFFSGAPRRNCKMSGPRAGWARYQCESLIAAICVIGRGPVRIPGSQQQADLLAQRAHRFRGVILP